MERRNELVGRLFRDGLYLEAVQSYSRDPPRSKEDRALFLGVLQSCLDHVITSSPAHLPAVFEAVFPQFEGDEGVLLVLGRTCLRREMYTEAEQFLLKVQREVSRDSLLAREGLRMIYEMAIPRWHFHMLNDLVRNSSYSHAISAAVARIPDCTVLDIGSGTGLLSMLAVRSGATKVYACDMDVTMATMSRDIIAANGMADKISVINKLSTDLTIPDNIPERVCLVVTETVDAGLLGEAIAKTFRHAWSQLLLPRQPTGSTNRIAGRGHVIPCGATVYVMAIECPYVARHSRLLSDVVGGLSFRGVTLEGSCKGPSESPDRKEGEGDGGGQGEREKQTSRVLRGRGRERGRGGGLVKEPYTCERLNCVTGGYTQLSVVHTALSIDFTNPEVPLPSVSLDLPVVRAGCLDAVAMYYDLHLDPTVSISTSPHGNQNCSWEQAIYPVSISDLKEGMVSLQVTEGDTICIRAVCTDSLLHMNVEGIQKNHRETAPCPVSGSSAVHFVDRGAMCRLNDAVYHEVYSEAIECALKLLQDSDSESESGSHTTDPHSPKPHAKLEEREMERNETSSTDADEEIILNIVVLDWSHELSILGLIAANKGADFVHLGRCHDIYRALLKEVAEGNGIQGRTFIEWEELETTSEPNLQWNVVLCDVVSPQGILRPNVFEELGTIRECWSNSDTVFLPGEVRVHCVGVSSPDLRAQTTVLGSVPTLGLDIARFINKYQVTHFIDMDLSLLAHERLTQETKLLSIDFNSLSTTPLKEEREVGVRVTSSGSLTGLVYWFSLHFPTGATITTAPHHTGEVEEHHWHQAAFCLQEDLTVCVGQKLTLRVLVRDSLLDISLATISTD